MKNNNLFFGIALIGIAYLLYRQHMMLSQYTRYNGPQAYEGQFKNVAPPPDSRTAAFNAWVRAILNLYGNVKELWAPGGPFHNIPEDEILDAVGDGSQYSDYA